MTFLTQPAPHSTTAGRRRERGAAHGPAREARARRSFDAVLASYVRELAQTADPADGKASRGPAE